MAKKVLKKKESWKIALAAGYVLIIGSALFFFISAQTTKYESQLDTSTITTGKQVPSSTIAEQIAVNVTSDHDGVPLFESQKALEMYVYAYSAQTRRDIVIVDATKKILADTIGQNIGTIYSEDSGEEVSDTLKDGSVRIFIEKGNDYPGGIQQTVVAIKDSTETIRGAVIVSQPLL